MAPSQATSARCSSDATMSCICVECPRRMSRCAARSVDLFRGGCAVDRQCFLFRTRTAPGARPRTAGGNFEIAPRPAPPAAGGAACRAAAGRGRALARRSCVVWLEPERGAHMCAELSLPNYYNIEANKRRHTVPTPARVVGPPCPKAQANAARRDSKQGWGRRSATGNFR